MNFNHVSVMLYECLDGLDLKEDGIYVDCTLGGAGHSLEICKKLGKNGKLIGIDQDINAINKSREVLTNYLDKVTFVNKNFVDIENILIELNIEKVDGFLLDLGVSSHQLDEALRGFSYMNDAPLDMRMDNRNEISAFEVVNKYSEKQLTNIFYSFGEEKWSKRVAEFIVKEREIKPIKTTFELNEIIKKAIPMKARKDGPHPSKRIYQAIRIEVNKELEILSESIKKMIEYLNFGGRICIITFHSLEDRIVKHVFKEAQNPCTCPKDFPICICNKKPTLKIITKKPITPSDLELLENHRSRSAKLRVGLKI